MCRKPHINIFIRLFDRTHSVCAKKIHIFSDWGINEHFLKANNCALAKWTTTKTRWKEWAKTILMLPLINSELRKKKMEVDSYLPICLTDAVIDSRSSA